MATLELHRRQVSQRRMQSPRVVEPLEIVEDLRPRLLAAREATTGLPFDQLGFHVNPTC